MSEETITRTYELGFLLVPTTPEMEVSKATDMLKGTIQKEGGTILSEGAPEFIDLAYTMEKSVGSKKMKWSQGYFGWIKFDADPAVLETLKKNLDSDAALIRYILVKTTAENTIVFKKPKVEAKRGTPQDEEEIIVVEDEAAVDEGPVELHDEHEKLPVLEEEIAEESTASPEA